MPRIRRDAQIVQFNDYNYELLYFFFIIHENYIHLHKKNAKIFVI